MQGKRSTTSWLTLWECCTSILCIYVGLKVPYVSGIDNVKGPDDRLFKDCALTELSSGTYLAYFALLDVSIDLIFIADLIVNFLTARWVIDTEGREHWRLVDDLGTLRKMYTSRCEENGFAIVPQFWVDFLGVIPWQYADCMGNAFTAIKNLRLLRLIRLTRLYRIKRLIESLRFVWPKSAFLINSCQLILVLFLVAHWMCCLWFFVGYVPDGWVHRQVSHLFCVCDVTRSNV